MSYSKGNRLATLETAIEMLPSSTVSMKVIEGIIGSAMQTSQWNTTAASVFDFQAASMRSSDLDECALGWHTCPQHADCINTDGSYTCHCKKGYVASGNAMQRVCVEKGETGPGDSDSDMWKKVTLIVSPIAVALLLCIVFIVICVTRRRHHRYKEDYSMTGRATPGSYNRHDSQARPRKEWRDSQHESDSTGFTRV
uniref:Extracellular matrix-related protein n=1 Tax=Branchiostoma floridae TaxID=7739 RepID=Q8WS62_BRAFL|nr:extracellular matrix-related protein [Branchiostoma floridae]